MKTQSCLLTLLIFIGIIVVISICCGSSLLLAGNLPSASLEPTDQVAVERQGDANTIAIIDIQGVIMEAPQTTSILNTQVASSSNIISRLDEAENNPDVKAVILRVNSPGGSVYASEKILTKIKELQSKDIKVVALFEELAASGGYYVSTSADKIVADDQTLTGSIGVLMQFQNFDELFDKVGIRTRDLTNTEGKYKTGAGLFDEDPNGEEDKIYQAIVDETYEHFVDLVSEGRNIPRDKVKTFADGRVFTGKQAKELGLVDEIGFMDKAIEVAESEAGISNATVVTYQYTDFWSLVMGITSKVSPLSSILEQTDIVPGAKLMYMFDAN